MTRKRPDDRMKLLVEAGTEVFITAQGYERTQMEDVAKRLGVSKGSLYLYVESKEALFDLCVRFADETGREELNELSLPYRAASGEVTLGYVQARLAEEPSFQEMLAILLGEHSPHPAGDLERLIRIMYRALYANRKAIKLVEAAAGDHPRLSGIWYPNARGQLLTVLIPYVERHVATGCFRPVTNAPIAARHLIETCTFWAIHRHWDPAPQEIEEVQVEDIVVHLILPVFLRASE